MAAISRVAVVTGANKGIGLAIVRQLALQYPQSTFSGGPLLVYLTARSAERGNEAIKTLENDAQLKKAKALAADGGKTTIKFKELDITKDESIHSLSSFLKKEHPEGIDIVINNAGIAMDGYNINIVKETLHTNYHGTVTITQDLLPLIRSGGRLVNVSSMSGHLNKYSDSICDEFRKASKSSIADVTSLLDRFTKSVEAGTEKKDGWPTAGYAVSKAGVTAASKVLDMQELNKGSGVRVEVCCPGYVNTDMSKGKGTKTPDEGAQTPAQLGLKIIGVKDGEVVEGFWKNEKEIEW